MVSVASAKASASVPADAGLIETGERRFDDESVAETVGEQFGQLVSVTANESKIVVVLLAVQEWCLQERAGSSSYVGFGVQVGRGRRALGNDTHAPDPICL
ncbi:hypothetical protein ASE25_11070 [Terrabacter sp. Root85]|nr:hypothetical protein ASE25_11070 [Terrabacter sp. Root85]